MPPGSLACSRLAPGRNPQRRRATELPGTVLLPATPRRAPGVMLFPREDASLHSLLAVIRSADEPQTTGTISHRLCYAALQGVAAGEECLPSPSPVQSDRVPLP